MSDIPAISYNGEATGIDDADHKSIDSAVEAWSDPANGKVAVTKSYSPENKTYHLVVRVENPDLVYDVPYGDTPAELVGDINGINASFSASIDDITVGSIPSDRAVSV